MSQRGVRKPRSVATTFGRERRAEAREKRRRLRPEEEGYHRLNWPGTDLYTAVEGHELCLVQSTTQGEAVLDVRFARGQKAMWTTTPPGTAVDLVPVYGATLQSSARVTVQRYGNVGNPMTQRHARVVVTGLSAAMADTLLRMRAARQQKR